MKSLSYPVRQLIAKEIELEKMRRLENALFKDKNEAIRQHNKPIIANQNDVRKPEGKVYNIFNFLHIYLNEFSFTLFARSVCVPTLTRAYN